MSKLKITAGIKKLLRILLFSATGIVLLLGGMYLLLKSPAVQTGLVHYITRKVEAETGVKIQIGGVDFRPVRSLVLNDVLLKDFKNDTLIYCRDLRVKTDSFNLFNRSFNISELVFDKACFHLWISRSAENAATNIEMFLDSLQKQKAPGLPSENALEKDKGWLVGLKKVSIRNSHFTYQEEEYEPLDYGVNWTDVECRDLNVDISGFNLTGEPVGMTVSGLSFVEKSGLQMRNLSGRVQIGEDNLVVTDCRIKLQRSEVDLVKLEFRWTPDQHDWRYFTTRMQQYYELGPSAVSFKDLAYFNGILRGIDNTVKCSGVVSNTIDQLEGHDLYFELGEKSVFQGSFKSAGLPDVWNTVFDIELYKAHLGPADLASVYLPWFSMNIPVPGPLYQLPYIDFERISFNGTLADFIVRAKSITPDLAGEVSFSYGPCGKGSEECASMKGDFKFDRINFGRLGGIGLLGYGKISGTYAGIWDGGGPSFHVNTRLHHVNINKGYLRDAEIALTFEEDKLDLMASWNDEQTQGGVVMSYDNSDSLNFMSLRGKLSLNDLDFWGWGIKTGGEQVSANFDLVHAGQKEKSFTNLVLSDLQYRNAENEFTIREISLEDSQYKKHNTTTLTSDILDLSIDGNYKEIRPLPFILKLVQNYLPAYTLRGGKKVKEKLADFDFNYAVNVKDINRVLAVFYPELSVSPGTRIVSYFRPGEESVNLELQADTVSYKDIKLIGSGIEMAGDLNRLKMKYAADKIVYGAGYQLYNVRNELVLADNHLDDKLSWCNWETKTYSGELSACVSFIPDGKQGYLTEIRLHPGVIVMDDSVWHVNQSTVFIEDKNINVRDFSIRRGKEFLSVHGWISTDPAEKLYINLENFNLRNFARIALQRRPDFFGMATGALTVQDYYQDLLLISDFEIDNWGISQDTLGSMRLRSYWDAENRSIIVGAENRVGNEVPLAVNGYYTPSTDALNVDVRLEKVGLECMGIYAAEYFSETTGHVSGNVLMRGALRKPDVSGFVYLDSVGVKINMLNTKFHIHDSVHIVNSRLLFRDFCLKDKDGHEALLDGEYRFLEDRYHLNAKFENFQVLNTDYGDNEFFYGRLYLSGLAELNNSSGETNVTVNARTENESRLYLPLSAGVTEQANNFLHFISNEQQDYHKVQNTYTSTDINLNANLELNEHLNVQVIFDPTVGDILKTTGKGNIKFAFDKDGNLSLFGDYRISRGDYLFTLSNLVNKKFVLTPGGTITWSGSPYDALLDINAVYSLKTTISELLPVTEKTGTDETGGGDEKTGNSDSGRKVPVECILNLSEHLTNPVVKFDINFPTLEMQSKSYLQSLFSSQDEINKQMFSLLVLNKFYRTDNTGDYGNQAQTAGVTTVTEMMSNQLSRWLSQISNNVDIGLAYRMGDPDREISSDEIEVALSTQLLNDRITISANGNMDVGGNKNAIGEDSKKTNIAGDFDIEVKLNKQGSLKMKAYSHTDEKLLYNNTETIQGVGVSYQESFDTFRELLRKYFGFLRRKKQ